ncbi:hypothetical protein OVY48_19740 [Sphingobium sp. SA2]|uniref:hypothetical protein n=1 Tax=Sphingobium sp. SA2 TaxID=1524832 RepID=UPI0028C0E5A0|nr:hypothetical protein [Sphingobium sp. SA2]MDT7535638.1 hypothetical protein [Sphingobium sp. SA2]
MTAFDEVREQIHWAETCIEHARAKITAYIQNDAFAAEIKVDAETGEYVHKIKLIRPVPIFIKGNLRNAMVDLKHAFDMALHAAARTLGASSFDSNYPWADTPHGLCAIIEKRQSKPNTRLPEILVHEIRRQEPYGTGKGYPGGNDLIRQVAKMANDKHSIGIVAAAQVQSVSFKTIRINKGEIDLVKAWNPVKKEIEIARFHGDIIYDNPKMTGNVFFERVGSLGIRPAIETATNFCNGAKACLEGFEAVCAND